MAALLMIFDFNLPVHGETKEEILPEIYIRAVNPGYTVDKVSNVNEMIEIAWGAPERPPGEAADGSGDGYLLAGITLRYTTSSGKPTDLVVFPEHSYLAGESILLRLASSPGSELANLVYTKTLAYEGSLELLRDEEVIDSVCWTGKEGCLAKFKSASPTTLVRDTETGDFTHETAEYAPAYAPGTYKVLEVPGDTAADTDATNVAGNDAADGKGGAADAGNVAPQCRGVIISEIMSYYAEAKTEQYVELHNTKAEQVLLDGCMLKYKNKKYPLSGILKADGYVARYAEDFSLTKNPTTSNTIEIVDVNGEVVYKVEYPNGQKKGAAYALIGYDATGEEIWKTTYAVTPGEPNAYQEFRSCEEGKVINEVTGNCVKVTEVKEKICEAGQYLNPLTGRCKKLTETTSSTTKECKEGYYYYEETGR
ncbi:hypothetical protein IJ135_01790 [Candidatus Saccharibacteria bacterium]|nr:hypothetical protein [Candidatus Saccharibacteria bacterium]